MKHESNPPKGGATETSAPKVVVAGRESVESKSIFDITNDELMNFLSGNNESLNFLDIKEPTSRSNSDQILANERPRRTSRKAWVSCGGGLIKSSRVIYLPSSQSVSDMTDSGSQSDETTSGTTSTGCGVDLERGEGSRYRRKREKRSGGTEKEPGSKAAGGGQRKKKGVLNAKERNMRRLESNERERKRMHDLNNQFQVTFCRVVSHERSFNIHFIPLQTLREVIPHIKKDRRLSKIETLTLAKNYITALTNVIVQIRSDGGKERPIPKSAVAAAAAAAAASKVLPVEEAPPTHCHNCNCFSSSISTSSRSVANSTIASWSTSSSPNVAVLGEICSGGGGGAVVAEKDKLEDVAVQLVADVATTSKNIQKMIEGAIPVDFDRNDFDEFDESSLYPANAFPLL